MVYPIRVRFPNVETGKSEWMTIGYIPAIKHKKGATKAEEEVVRLVRGEVLQRCLAVILNQVVPDSKYGVTMHLHEHGTVLAVPRIVLYACDQPEERHVLGMKLSGCYYPCSYCKEHSSTLACPSMGAAPRDVPRTLDEQLEAGTLRAAGERPGRVKELGDWSSVSPIVPVLGAVHGLGTGSLSLFDIFGFDTLHVSAVSIFLARLICARVFLSLFSGTFESLLFVVCVFRRLTAPHFCSRFVVRDLSPGLLLLLDSPRS